MTLRVLPRVNIIADTTALEIISGNSITFLNVVTVCKTIITFAFCDIRYNKSLARCY